MNNLEHIDMDEIVNKREELAILKKEIDNLILNSGEETKKNHG